MGRFIMDIHVHTSEVSGCARVKAAEVVRLYQRAGYQGIMITDHFHKTFFDSLVDIKKWEDKVDRYLIGYRKAKEEGKRIGMQVLLGMEFRNYASDNDFLIIGLTEKFLYEYPELYNLPLEKAIDLFHENNMLVIQAHPVRFKLAGIENGNIFTDYTTGQMLRIVGNNTAIKEIPYLEGMELIKKGYIGLQEMPLKLRVCKLLCEEKLDGIEIYNGNSRWAQEPELIQKIIEKHPEYIQISGSDFHQKNHLAKGGIVLRRNVISSTELREELKVGNVIRKIQKN